MIKNNKDTRVFIKNILENELRNLMVNRKGTEINKLFYMFMSGVELETQDGKIVNELPIGPFLGYMVNIYENKCISQDLPDPFIKLRFTGERLRDLAKFAETNIFAQKAAEELSAHFLQKNGNVPKELIPIVISALKKENVTKKSRGQHPYANIHRNTSIIMLMEGIENEGFFPITRNDESLKENNISLCDLMSESCIKIGLNIGYNAIKFIWRNRKDLSKYSPPFRISFQEDSEGNTTCYIGYANPYKIPSI